MGVRAPRPVAILTAVLFALSVFGFTLFVWRSFGGTIPFAAKGYRFHVQFGTEAVQLTSGAEARVSGVRIGKVKSVTYTNQKIDAEIQIESRFAPMPSDARAIVRSKTLLGEAYIELTPGTKSAPKLEENGVLPLANVQAAQTLDEVLGTFDKQTRDDFKTLLDSLAVAFDGRAQDVNDTLGNLPGASADLREFTELLDRQRSGVQRLLRESGTALQAIGDSQADVQALVRSADAVFGTTAGRAAEMTRLVQALPPFLRDLRATLEVADATTTDAAPALAALRPTAPLLRPALNAASRLAPELERTFIALPPVLDAARDGLPALTRDSQRRPPGDARPLPGRARARPRAEGPRGLPRRGSHRACQQRGGDERHQRRRPGPPLPLPARARRAQLGGRPRTALQQQLGPPELLHGARRQREDEQRRLRGVRLPQHRHRRRPRDRHRRPAVQGAAAVGLPRGYAGPSRTSSATRLRRCVLAARRLRRMRRLLRAKRVR